MAPVKKILVVAVLCSMAVFTNAQKLIFTPQWLPQGQFAGYYVALEKGFYREKGLEVSIVHPSASNKALNRLIDGKSDIITCQLIPAIRAIDQGIPLINILQTSQDNSLMLISREEITVPGGLAGKKVGIWKAGFDELARIFDRQHKLDIEWIPFVENVNLFVSGAIDATLAMSYNEYFQILSTGVRLKPEGIWRFAEMGYNVPEDGVYVMADFYRNNREAVEKFAEASRKGWEWAAAHPEETLDIVMQKVKEHNIGTNREHQKWMLKEVLSLQKNGTTGKATFTLSPEALDLTNRLLIEYYDLKKEVTLQQITVP